MSRLTVSGVEEDVNIATTITPKIKNLLFIIENTMDS